MTIAAHIEIPTGVRGGPAQGAGSIWNGRVGAGSRASLLPAFTAGSQAVAKTEFVVGVLAGAVPGLESFRSTLQAQMVHPDDGTGSDGTRSDGAGSDGNELRMAQGFEADAGSGMPRAVADGSAIAGKSAVAIGSMEGRGMAALPAWLAGTADRNGLAARTEAEPETGEVFTAGLEGGIGARGSGRAAGSSPVSGHDGTARGRKNEDAQAGLSPVPVSGANAAHVGSSGAVPVTSTAVTLAAAASSPGRGPETSGTSAARPSAMPAWTAGGAGNEPQTPARLPSIPSLGDGGHGPSMPGQSGFGSNGPETPGLSWNGQGTSDTDGIGAGPVNADPLRAAGARTEIGSETAEIPGGAGATSAGEPGQRSRAGNASAEHFAPSGTAIPAIVSGSLRADGAGTTADAGTPDEAWAGRATETARNETGRPGAGPAQRYGLPLPAIELSAGSGGVLPVPGAGPARLEPQSPEVQAPLAAEASVVAGQASLGAGVARTAGRAGTAAATAIAAGHASGAAPLQIAGTVGEAAGIMRVPAGNERVEGGFDGGGRSAPGTGMRETFAALDSGGAPGAPTWTHAGARQVEAGFQDQELGWVGVRADLTGGGVHAVLVPGSAEAAQALGSHLDGLHSYLAEQHARVDSLGMAAPGGGGAGAGDGFGKSGGEEMGQGTQQGSDQQGHPAAREPTLNSSQRLAGGAAAARSGGAGSVPEVYASAGGGVHISVMA